MRETATVAATFGTPTPSFEVRAAGRFSASEVREILNGQLDLRQIGCPEHLFVRSLEKRVASRVRVADAERLRRAKAAAVAIAMDAAKTKVTPMTYADRRKWAEEVKDKIKYDEAQEYLRVKKY